MTTAMSLANAFAAKVRKLDGLTPDYLYGPVVRNKKQTTEHGWIPGALASVSYEGGVDMSELTLTGEFAKDGLYIEPYSSWLVGVFKV